MGRPGDVEKIVTVNPFPRRSIYHGVRHYLGVSDTCGKPMRWISVIFLAMTLAVAAQQQPQRPSRDTSAPQNQKDAPPPPTGRISGRTSRGTSTCA